MVKMEIDVDSTLLFLKPNQLIQQFSLRILQERQALLDSMKGIEWKNSSMSGKVEDCSTTTIVIQSTDGKKHELPLTAQRLRQLLTAVTTRK